MSRRRGGIREAMAVSMGDTSLPWDSALYSSLVGLLPPWLVELERTLAHEEGHGKYDCLLFVDICRGTQTIAIHRVSPFPVPSTDPSRALSRQLYPSRPWMALMSEEQLRSSALHSPVILPGVLRQLNVCAEQKVHPLYRLRSRLAADTNARSTSATLIVWSLPFLDYVPGMPVKFRRSCQTVVLCSAYDVLGKYQRLRPSSPDHMNLAPRLVTPNCL